MEAKINIRLNPQEEYKLIALPINFAQLKAEFKKAYDLTENQLSNLTIYYYKRYSDEAKFLENDSTYNSFLSENDNGLIEADINEEENKEENIIKVISEDSNLESEKEKILRCCENNCYLIPSIKIIKDKNNNLMINYHCRNNHTKENMPIKEFLSLSNKEIKDICCNYCSLNKETNKDLNLKHCYKCQKYICNLDNNKHSSECNNNILIEIEKIDSTCNIHGKNLNHFCDDCKKYKKKTLLNEINKNLKNLDIIYNEIKNVFMKKITDVYEMNKNLLELNRILLDNLNNNLISGEIKENATNAFFMKTNKIEKTLSYYNDSFEILENYFKEEFFEFNSEKQTKLLKFRRGIPVEISYGENKTCYFGYGYYTDIQKFARKIFPPDATMSYINYYFKQKIHEKDPQYRHAYILKDKDEVPVPEEITIGEVYEKYKRNDDILYCYLKPNPWFG